MRTCRLRSRCCCGGRVGHLRLEIRDLRLALSLRCGLPEPTLRPRSARPRLPNCVVGTKNAPQVDAVLFLPPIPPHQGEVAPEGRRRVSSLSRAPPSSVQEVAAAQPRSEGVRAFPRRNRLDAAARWASSSECWLPEPPLCPNSGRPRLPHCVVDTKTRGCWAGQNAGLSEMTIPLALACSSQGGPWMGGWRSRRRWGGE